MPVYLFPMKERYINYGDPPHVIETLFFLRGVEVACYHKYQQIIVAGMIRDLPFNTRTYHYRLEADDPDDALYRLSKSCRLALGDEDPRSRAHWLDDTSGRLIEELPDCDLRHVNDDAEYICGPQDLSDPTIVGLGEHGICLIEDFRYGPKFTCPVRIYKRVLHQKKKRGRLPIERIGGHPFVRAIDLFKIKRRG